MSAMSKKIYRMLKELFPLNVVLKEHYVNYKGTKLFFDFYIKDLGVLIEVQGEQHSRFIKHFHEDKEGFSGQKKRDNLKLEYAEDKEIAFIQINYDEKISDELILNKIFLALKEKGDIDYDLYPDT
jgi:hypothetical protein